MPGKDCYELILNQNCDLRCSFCSQADFDPAARCAPAAAVRRIYTAKKLGYTRLGFSGGEALLCADLPRLAAAAKKVGFRAVRLQTNGMRLASRALCEKLAAAGLTVCKFTFLGSEPKVHDALTGVKGSFRRSLAGLDNMLDLKLAVGVNLLLTRSNYRRLPEALKFFMDRGVTDFVLIYPIYVGAMRANYRRTGVALPEAAPAVVRALDLAQAAGLADGVKALNVPPCLLPGHENKAVDLYKFNTVVAAPDGRTWDIDKNVAGAKRHGPPCARCLLKPRCKGVDHNYLDLFGWAGISPVLKLTKKRPLSPVAGYLNAMEKCFMEALKLENGISTARLLELARGLPLCHDCRDGAGVMTTGAALEKKGLVKKEFKGGRYLWRRR
ncbi:MAG: radical SAM protein [Elusimicrobiales bacterium]|nr:radical SAM protein [Elusimicrobiales bacterium]